MPSKALIHVSRMLHDAKKATAFGLEMNGTPDMNKVTAYIHHKQNIIRQHENASYIRSEGVDVVLGLALFETKNSIKVNKDIYKAKRIVLASGSRPKRLIIPGVEMVNYYDNESIFNIYSLPKRLLIIGGGPIGIEMCQAMNRLGSEVTVVHSGNMILPHDNATVAEILLERLQREGVKFILNTRPEKFISPNEVIITGKDRKTTSVNFDAVIAAIGREPELDELRLPKAGIEVKNKQIVRKKYQAARW